ncbi:DUF1428 domain-containing protein [Cereibacter azotoformans]|uniref:DUF1428 domain-containing protein n=1 Tax=Cereibacter sphaeroides (strain ATCC 17025 / ATH 2.4.3) TaxID=349102 RepID=A4WYN5_CERS5|nr:DUF1428 domain-containing protein [Cereibacter azotoformans]ULB11953.1 DUF1428 domain-containing protein [Cereibacter azotoformans]
MTCITGFVGAVPTGNRQAFIEHARLAAEGFRDHGLSDAVECWGEDVPDGKVTSFPLAVQARPDETVIFSWYRWPSKAAQDEGMRRAMEDPRLNAGTNPMPFDGQRVIWGSFEPLFEVGAPQAGGYFDGFVIPVPRDKREAFRAFASACDPIFVEHGAVWIVEAWELEVPDGKLTDFRRAVAATPDEAIVFSWVQWPDATVRGAANARVMDDPRMAALDCPFDMKRVIWGGFSPVIQT